MKEYNIRELIQISLSLITIEENSCLLTFIF